MTSLKFGVNSSRAIKVLGEMLCVVSSRVRSRARVRSAILAAAALLGAAGPVQSAGGPPPLVGFTAVVCNGVLVRGKGVSGVTKIAIGQFEVLFNMRVAACTSVATIGLPGSIGMSAPGEITVVGRSGKSNGVLVATSNSAGGSADRCFHLIVAC